jgi:propanol-preferring alcohol dehydrogenase
MVLEAPRTPLVMRERPTPEPKQDEILVEIAACGVCRADLHVRELQHPNLPIVPGHEIVGRIAAIGRGLAGFCSGRARRSAMARFAILLRYPDVCSRGQHLLGRFHVV